MPGRDVALQLLLQRRSDGLGVLLVLPFRVDGTNPDGSPAGPGLEPLALARGESAVSEGTDFSIELRSSRTSRCSSRRGIPGRGSCGSRSGS